ncbi:MAG: SGNH/GDSL hydrolase family protein [Porcipelethomonas sp.]
MNSGAVKYPEMNDISAYPQRRQSDPGAYRHTDEEYNTRRNRTPSVRRHVRYDRIIMTLGPFVMLFCFLTGHGIMSLFSSGIGRSISDSAAVQSKAEVTQASSTPPGDNQSAAGAAAISSTAAVSDTETTDTAVPASASALTAQEKQQRHDMYPQELVVVGDSIASGFSMFEYIPMANGLAQGSVGIRSIHDYTFTCQGAELDITDAVSAMQPAYIYMSMGMNDVNMITSDDYKELYLKEIKSMLAVSPQSDIIVASITPICASCDFTENSTIREFNSKLQQAVEEINLPNVTYFDAYSLLSDPATQALKDEYTSGDGIHHSRDAYDIILPALYDRLDSMPYPSELIKTDQQ